MNQKEDDEDNEDDISGSSDEDDEDDTEDDTNINDATGDDGLLLEDIGSELSEEEYDYN